MGERGPAPTPTKMLEMRGSWRAKKRQGEPKPERSRPQCPRWLRKEAKRIWEELIPQIDEMGILGRCDRHALARYCQALANWRLAEEWVMEHGDVYPEKNEKGEVIGVKEYPQVGKSIRLAEMLLRLEKQFGLNPAARAGLGTVREPPDPNDPKARFFEHLDRLNFGYPRDSEP